MTDRVRSLLITPDGDLLTIQRTRPGQDPSWVLPGGGVEDGEDLEAWSVNPGDRTGPEFTDPARGDHRLQPIPLTVSALTAIDLKPEPLARFLIGHLRTGTDLFTLPDLRTSQTTRA